MAEYLKKDGKFDYHRWSRKNTVTGPDKSHPKAKVKETSVNERFDRSTLKRMEGLHHVQNLKSGLKYLRDVQGDLIEEGFDEQEVWEFFLYKMQQFGIGK